MVIIPTVVKDLGAGCEKSHIHSSVLPLIVKINIPSDYSGRSVSHFGLMCFSLLLEGKFLVGHVYIRFALFSLCLVPSILILWILAAENIQRHLNRLFPFPCSHPWAPRHSIKMLPMHAARLASWSLTPALNPRSVTCHQSPATSSPQLNEQIRREN